MEDFNFLFTQEVDWVLVTFLSFFSAFVAVFYTVIISGLYNIKLKPKWLFFVLLPGVLIVTKILFPNIVIGVFVILFITTFVLAIFGFVYRLIHNIILRSKEKVKAQKKGSVVLEAIKFLVITILLISCFLFFGHLAFIIIFFYFILKKIFFPDTKNTFLKLQTTLPTSKIRSMAMGLVEVTGKVKIQESVISRLDKKECIGYTYRIESISRDKDGKKSYSTIEYETVCNPFIIQDTTGEVLVSNKDLELLDLEIDKQYSSGSKRYTQCLLLDGEEMLLIGKANKRKELTIIEKDTVKDIFGLMAVSKISRWNQLKPIRDSVYVYITVFLFLTGILLISNMTIEDNRVILNLNSSVLDIDFLN